MIVAEKLKQEGKQEVSQTEMMEELEDEDGNVYNRKVSPLDLLTVDNADAIVVDV